MPIPRRTGDDPQVLRHLDLAAAVGVAAEDEDLALRVRLRRMPTPGMQSDHPTVDGYQNS